MQIPENLGPTAKRERATTGETRRRSSPGLVQLLDSPHDFNFRHFRMRHMLAELLRTLRSDGVLPGRRAPTFELTTTRGDMLRLRDLRGQPVLLHFVSYT